MVRNVILVNDNGCIRGGADAVAISTAIGMAQKGVNVVFFAATSPVADLLINGGVKVICLDIDDILHERNRLKAIKNGIYNRKAGYRFKQLLHDYSPENTLVHIHTWTKALSSSVFYEANSLGFKILLTLHDYFTVCPNGGFFNYNSDSICNFRPLSWQCITCNCDLRSFAQKQWRVLRQLIQNNNIRRVKHLYLLPVSKKVSDIVAFYLNSQFPMIYLHNPIEILDKSDVPISKNKKYLFMGRLAKEKGPELFCEAITQLGLDGVVVGDGYLKKDLERKYPTIEFTGWLSGKEKIEILEQCKCFIFTSKWYETFGLVVAEMQSFGIPSIVPAESAAAEQIRNGYNGLLFQGGNIESLKKNILEFEKMDLETIHRNVLESFKPEIYSLGSYINNLLEIYNKIIYS